MSWPPGWDASCNINVFDITKHEKKCLLKQSLHEKFTLLLSRHFGIVKHKQGIHHMFEFLMMVTNKALCDPVFLFSRKEHAQSNVASSTPNILHI